MILSKTLNTSDYESLKPYSDDILEYKNSLGDITRFEHTHRLWEYAITVKALEESIWPISTILAIGEGGSVILPYLTVRGYDIVGMDTSYNEKNMKELSKVSKLDLQWMNLDFFNFGGMKYDAVICNSVIEHVEKDAEFFTKLLETAYNLIVLTADFHPSGEKIVDGHLRTYNKNTMGDLIVMAAHNGFQVPNREVDYDYFEPNVNGCTFASLMLERKKV